MKEKSASWNVILDSSHIGVALLLNVFAPRAVAIGPL